LCGDRFTVESKNELAMKLELNLAHSLTPMADLAGSNKSLK